MQDLFSKDGGRMEAGQGMAEFRGATFVIKYGGSFMDSPDPAVREGVARDVVWLEQAGVKPVLVHGGGKAITAALASAGAETRFVQGLRVTNEAAALVVERVLSKEINPEIVNTISRLGGRARGFSGTEIFTCRKLWLFGPDGGRLDAGFVGEVTAVRTQPVADCLREGITPVLSPTALGPEGQIYNCNADVAAAAVAGALRARRLIFLSDVPGLLRDAKNPQTLIPRLHAGEVEALKKAGVIEGGMIPKVDSAVAALRAGVEKVTFVDGRSEHAVRLELLKGQVVGTEIVL